MYCSKCGKQIPDDSVFCPECGQGLGNAAAPAAAPALEGEVPQAVNIGIIAGSIIIPLIGIIMGIIYLRDASPAKQKAGKVWLWVGIAMAIFWLLVSLGG